jgi:hypothetical protein
VIQSIPILTIESNGKTDINKVMKNMHMFCSIQKDDTHEHGKYNSSISKCSLLITGATSGAGTAYLSGEPDFTLGF